MSFTGLNRRRFLLLAGAGLAAGGAAYTWYRGVRYPLLHFAGTGPETAAEHGGVAVAARGAALQEAGDGVFHFRAFVPEPVVIVRGGREARIVVENLHRQAALEAGGRAVAEDGNGLRRSVTVQPGGDETRLAWRFPRTDHYRFAAIGDSGGGSELRWVLKRAAALGADFLIHLGDIYYEHGDFDRAEANLNQSSIPTYAAIGNHDFHNGWRALYPRFHRVIGPSNSAFTLGGIDFVNVDTAADFIPAVRGRRAQVIRNLRPVGDSGIRDRVAITHMPLHDPEPDRAHAVGRRAEADWLRERFLASGARNLLVGHIHIKAEFDDQGLHTWITGQGLGHADLIGEQPYRRYAEILLGEVEPGQPVRYRWQPLNMPFEAHCNARNLGMLDSAGRPGVKARLMALCGKT